MKKNIKGKGQKSKDNSAPAKLIIKIAIILLAIVLYGKSINYSFTLDDDLFYVKNNTVLKGTKGIPDIFKQNSLFGFFGMNNVDEIYRPVTLSTFAIQKQIFGVDAKVSHFFNIGIYILSGLALFSLLKLLFRNYNIWIPGIISLIYIAHPIHTEVVCSIKSRDEIIAALFGFLALRSVAKLKDNYSYKQVLLGCFFMLIALFSKESSLTFIGIVPLIFYFFSERNIKQSFLSSIPFFLAAIFMITVRYFVLLGGNADANQSTVLYNGLNAAQNAVELYATRFYILLLFVWKSIIPYPLTWDYSYNQIPMMSFSSPAVIASILLHIVLVGFAFYLLPKKHPISFGLLFYFATSFITNNFFIKVGATFAERFLFMPITGMWIFLIMLTLNFIKEKDTNKLIRIPAVKALAGMVLLLFSIETFARVPDWENNFKLYEAGIKYSANSSRANSALADQYRDKAIAETNPQEKERLFSLSTLHYKKSIEIFPGYSDPYYNLGVIQFNRKDTADAIEWMKKALIKTPKYRNSLYYVGMIYLMQKNIDSSLVYLNKMQEFYPNDKTVLTNLGYVYLQKKQYEESKKYCEMAINQDPNNPTNYQNIAAAYGYSGDTAAANRYWNKYMELKGKN